MIKTIIVLLNFTFKCRLVNEKSAIGMQASTQANQLASAIDRAGNITNFTENGLNTYVILVVFYCVYWKRIFKNQRVGFFVSFHILVEVD